MSSGDLETTHTLLFYGANVNSTNSIIIPCLNVAQVYVKCQHPLVIAAELGNIPLVKLLLSKGADPNGLTTYKINNPIVGGTKVTRSIGPLHCAVQRKDRDLVKVLLLHGTRTDMKDRRGNTLLHLLCDECDCYSRYNNNGYSTSPHQDCYEQGDMIKLLMSSCHTSKTLSMRNDDGYDPLDQVVLNGCITRVQILLDAGADPNLRDLKCFGSPLHVALCNRFYDIGEILVQHGSNLNQTNLWGDTPLAAHMLLPTGCSDTMNTMLIVHGASLEVTARYQSLMTICIGRMEKGWQEMCRLLFYAGCSMEEGYWQGPFDFAPSKEDEVCACLRTSRNNPHTLMDLSRIYIRKFLSEKVTNGRSIAGSVVKLPLPRLVQDHLLLKDLVDYNCFTNSSDI